MAKAIRFYETGSPDVLRYEDMTVGDPGPYQACLRHLAAGRIKIEINQRYALEDAVRAHRDLECRETTGSSIFVI
jgi:NADPH:quinone reductase-like Zn-dependent oxidoreductase